MRRALVVSWLGSATFASSAIASPSPARLDRFHGVRFNLSGSVLKVRLVTAPGMTRPDTRKEVWGKRIRAICSPTFTPGRRSAWPCAPFGGGRAGGGG